MTAPLPPRGAFSGVTQPPPVTIIDTAPRCWKCGRVLMAYAARPWSVRCKRCRSENKSGS